MNKLATYLYTYFCGLYLGSDQFGNKYYQSKKPDGVFGRKHRWVIYKGDCEPSKIPSQWYCWIHQQTDEIPLSNEKRYAWEKPHVPNLTGTKNAYYPKGHALAGAIRDKATGDYESWRPE